MKNLCRRVRLALELDGPEAVRAIEGGVEHLEGCDRCFETLEAQAALEAALRELPVRDAPDDLVERLLADRSFAEPASPGPGEESGTSETPSAWSPSRSRRWMVAIAATLTVGVGLVLLRLQGGVESLQPGGEVEKKKKQHVVQQVRFQRSSEKDVEENAEDETKGAASDRMPALGYVGGDEGAPVAENEPIEALADELDAPGASEGAEAEARQKAAEDRPMIVGGELEPADRFPARDAHKPAAPAPAPGEPSSDADAGEVEEAEVFDDASTSSPLVIEALRKEERLEEDRSTESGRRDAFDGSLHRRNDAVANRRSPDALDSSARFLAERERVEGLRFQEAQGIWRNTYLPGDPVLRRAALRLERAVESGDDLAKDLERLGRPSDAILDPPSVGALALSVRADRRAVEGPSRVLVQVGLRATERRPGQRPPMEVALVLDLRSGDPDGRQRAAAEALARHRRAGDRFWVFALGPEDPLLVRPEELRSGPVRVALDDALAGLGTGSVNRNLREVLERALAAVSSGDDAADVLGTESIVLMLAGPVEAPLRPVLEIVHRAAVRGVATTAVAAGPGAEPTELDALALEGQGRRRSLGGRVEASDLVEAELSAGSEIVARALRLRLRLAPDVRLVGIPGSHRLSAPEAVRAREVERALDLRIARERGIETDRDEEDDGILVLIPSFRAGDEHVVLLDLLVPGPGPVAEVSLRFKDLIAGRNGVVRDRLELGRGEAALGPLEWAVRKSLLGVTMRRDLERAAADLEAGRPDVATSRIDGLADLVGGLRSRVGQLADDPDLVRDAALLERLRSVVEGTASIPSMDPSESLRLAAARRLVPPISPETEVLR